MNKLLRDIGSIEDPLGFMGQFCDTPIYRVSEIRGDLLNKMSQDSVKEVLG